MGMKSLIIENGYETFQGQMPCSRLSLTNKILNLKQNIEKIKEKNFLVIHLLTGATLSQLPFKCPWYLN